MKYLIVEKTRCGYAIRAEIAGNSLPRFHYIGWSKRDAIRFYRRDNGLTRKQFIIVEV